LFLQQHRALAKVVDDERRHHQSVPGDADRQLAEVAQVGVQRFAAGDHEHHRTQADERDQRVVDDEINRVGRAECREHVRVDGDVGHTQRNQRDEPDERDRPECLADAAGAQLLGRKQHCQHHQRYRDHELVQLWRRDLQPFDRREHRDRWGDHAIAVEHRRAEQPEHGEHAVQRRAVAHGMGRQREHRNQAAFAIVVGAQDEQHVLDRDDHGDRPEHQ
jgi:hypothetical protein